MNLHANAALSLKGRQELCLAVVERERTLARCWQGAGRGGRLLRLFCFRGGTGIGPPPEGP